MYLILGIFKMLGLIIFICASCLFVSTISKAEIPSQYEQLRARLINGVPTVSIVDLAQCTKKSGVTGSGPGPVGGFRIDGFQILLEPNPRIAYAYKHYTVRPDGTPVVEFLQYRVMPDDTATLTIRVFSATEYKSLIEPIIYECTVGNGMRFVP